ncbi:hypothetical protein FQN60_016910, partial [Etheostoma spectabile]
MFCDVSRTYSTAISEIIKMDKGDGTHIGANQEICLRLEAIEDIAQDERHGAGMISRLHIVIINGLEDEGIALLRGIMDEEQPSDDDDDSIAVVNDDLDNGDEVLQEEDATAEPQVDMDANQPSEAEGSLSGGCRTRSREEDDDDEMSSKRFRCLTDAISDGDNDSDAEEDEAMSMPSSSSLPGGSRRSATKVNPSVFREPCLPACLLPSFVDRDGSKSFLINSSFLHQLIQQSKDHFQTEGSLIRSHCSKTAARCSCREFEEKERSVDDRRERRKGQ